MQITFNEEEAEIVLMFLESGYLPTAGQYGKDNKDRMRRKAIRENIIKRLRESQ